MLVNLNDKFFPSLKKRSINENASIAELVEEAVMEHLNISIVELNSDDLMTDEDDLMTDEDDPNYKYYVYALVDKRISVNITIGPIDIFHQPFYIGKGTGNRVFSEKNTLVEFKKERLGDNYEEIILMKNLTNKEAHRIENNLITLIGKEIDNAGPLLNYSGGKNFKSDEEIIENLNLERMRNLLILKALNNSNSIKKAAQKLDLSVRTLQREIKALKLIKKIRFGHLRISPILSKIPYLLELPQC